MDKFDEYLENKSENEKQEFALPKSFEYKLEETLENLDKEKQEKTNGWYNNKKLWTTAACFAFIFIAGMSVKYGVDFNKSDSIEKSLDNQIARYSADIPEIDSNNESEARSSIDNDAQKGITEEFSLQDTLGDSFIDSTNIDKVIIKNVIDGNTYKSVDNKIDIDNIIEFINNISKEEVPGQLLGDWDFLIQTNGLESNHTIIIKDYIMNIDDKYYKISPEDINIFKDMYNNLNYDKNTIPYCNY